MKLTQLLSLAVFSAPLLAQTPPPAATSPTTAISPSAQIKNLSTDREQSLTKLIALLPAAIASGQATQEQLSQAQLDLLALQRDRAKSGDETISFQKQIEQLSATFLDQLLAQPAPSAEPALSLHTDKLILARQRLLSEQLRTTKLLGDQAHNGVRALLAAEKKDPLAIAQAVFVFSSQYPEHPLANRFFLGLETMDDGLPTDQQTAYGETLGRLIETTLADPATPKHKIDTLMAIRALRAKTLALRQTPANPNLFRAEIDAYRAAFPAGRAAETLEFDYVAVLEKIDPALAIAHLKKLAADTSTQRLAEKATGTLKKRGLVEKPIEMKFTAVDGRPVDLAQLRGKVILVDFWATWCGPCIRELPTVIAAYEKYHNKGFEVIGISLENAQITPKDTPEQIAAKHAAAKAKLTNFTTAKKMPWPQYYDGKHWENELSRQYNISGIPAMMLIGKDGLLIDTDARGEKLEKYLEQLL